MMTKQTGFTLIELMIVIAIIGLLAAIAIPSFQNYTTKAQTSEAITLLKGAQSAIDEYVSQTGNFPASLGELNVLGVLTSGLYVSSISSTNNGDGSGSILATFQSNDIATPLKGRAVQFSRDSSGDWSCGTSSTGTTVNRRYLPTACR